MGIPVEYHCPGMEPEVLQVWEETAERLAAAGAAVTQVPVAMYKLGSSVLGRGHWIHIMPIVDSGCTKTICNLDLCP